MSKQKNIKNKENSEILLVEKQEKQQAIMQNKETSQALVSKNKTNQKPAVIKKQEKAIVLAEKNKNQSSQSNNKNQQSEQNKFQEQKISKTENKADVDNQGKNFTKEEKQKSSSNIFTIFGILLGSLVLIILIAFLVFSFTMSNSTNIHTGIYIKSIDVSEMSKESAKSKIETYIKSKLPEEIIVTHNDYEIGLNTEELDIKFDINSAVNTAYSLGRNNKLVSDGMEILSTMINNKNVEPTFTLDEELLTKKLQDISTKLPDKVIESGYYIEGKNLILNKGSDGNVVNVEKTKQKIKNEIKNLNLKDKKIELNVSSASPTELDLDAIYKEVKKDAVDAKFSKEPLAVTPSENGVDFSISIDEAKNKLAESEQECTIPLKVVYPTITTNMIGTEAFPDVLSNFSTNYAASNVNRTTNLRLAANKINGTVLMPGETFSYNQVVGERTIAAGYKEAPIYVSGRVEDGLGGGICQITTTLYNAAVYANLDIVERTNHQFVPSYVGAGRDATVVYGAIDFKFKNNRDYPIKLICSVSGGVANFQILGLKTSNDYDVEISSRITSQTANYTNSETYKILKKNGSVVSQVLLSKDTYKRH